ncbi:hypothetical protein Tco_1233399 [Tanacetum coccineum]
MVNGLRGIPSIIKDMAAYKEEEYEIDFGFPAKENLYVWIFKLRSSLFRILIHGGLRSNDVATEFRVSWLSLVEVMGT